MDNCSGFRTHLRAGVIFFPVVNPIECPFFCFSKGSSKHGVVLRSIEWGVSHPISSITEGRQLSNVSCGSPAIHSCYGSHRCHHPKFCPNSLTSEMILVLISSLISSTHWGDPNTGRSNWDLRIQIRESFLPDVGSRPHPPTFPRRDETRD